MNKKEFVNYLESRLSILNKAERDDIVNEYIQHIDNKLAEGLSEKEAVETLGNIDDMVREILSAYNVDPDYNKAPESEINAVVEGLYEKFKMGLRSISDYLLGQKLSSIFGLFIKTVCLFFVLSICFVIGREICYFFVNIIGGWQTLKWIVRLMYTIVAVPTMIYIFVRFLDYNIKSGKVSNENSSSEKVIKEEVKEVEFENTENKTDVKPIARKLPVKKVNSDFSFGNIIKSILLFALKVFVIMCLIPCVFTLFFTIISFGGLFVMSFAGYPFWGITLGCLGFNMVGCAIIVLIIKLIFFNKGAVEK